VRFTRRLTRELLRFPDVVLMSTGFLHAKRHPHRVSVDAAVVGEAETCLTPAELARRFETWLPAGRDRPVDRFAKGVVHRVGETAQQRRFALVRAADAIVTVAGEVRTRMVLELALALARPTLPVAFTGGDSARIWKPLRDEIVAALHVVPPKLVARLEARPTTDRQVDRLAADVATAAHMAAEKRCLVLMPFGGEHDTFYTEVLYRTIERAGWVPDRLDRDAFAGHIPALFLAHFARARAVVVDVTGSNPNVMYELGQVHARGVDPFLVLRGTSARRSITELPFYLRQEKLSAAADGAAGWRRIGRELARYLQGVAAAAAAGRS
jgi:hypothetical protein